jgi:hypothetical protein
MGMTGSYSSPPTAADFNSSTLAPNVTMPDLWSTTGRHVLAKGQSPKEETQSIGLHQF